MDTTVLILIIVVVVLIVALAALGFRLSQRSRSQRLEQDFGPEYERSVRQAGDRKAAETELRDRQRRRNELEIRALGADDHHRYTDQWSAIQRGFVDNPAGALDEADRLVVEIMKARGYPVDDFDRRADDISVDHPEIVHHYRDARSVRDSAPAGVDTEQQRRALTSYRKLVDALLENDRHTSDTETTEQHVPDRAVDARRHNEEQTR